MAQFALTTAANVARAYVASMVSRAISGLFAEPVQGPRVDEFSLQTSSEGATVPIVYGRMRTAGQVIWAAYPVETSQTRSAGGGKGGPKVTEYSYTLSFAVAVAEGPIGGIGQIWADGQPIERAGLVMRVYTGAEDQTPDPLIEAIEGAGQAPAYRGLAYVVFEDLPLDEFGARIPNLNFEVFAPTRAEAASGSLETLIEGVCLIPASGEFAYATQPVLREIIEGYERAENVHTDRAPTDFDAALDDLEARLPNCRSVALVTSWFGDDLRAGDCTLKPGVETRDKTTRPLIWSAAGQTRATAHLISQGEGGPVYGGAPSDETIIAAINALKARGYAVTLYPFILMDVPPGNGLPDPYGGAEQAEFPWRGRITCHPAAGQPGTVDRSAAAAGQVDAFFGAVAAGDFEVSAGAVTYSGPAGDWGFNRFILHHAALAAAAGGVESFIIGSEMRGLTQIRSGAATYPAVAKLRALAGQARAILGPQVKVSYAADWSEYSGHAPSDGSGDRFFHLDPLWADADIDFVGIDWYAPLSDWRDGTAHADALAGAQSIHDPAYLSANVEGGEGYDWFYASSGDRDAQVRTPITDGAYGEPWVWRYKDLKTWWANPHHDRPGGVRAASPTAWIPESKPIRLVELGCPAVDKGANQPNVFIDPKSSESFAPYYSSGARDDLIQRRSIEALIGYWSEPGRNPVSSLYGQPMLDLPHCHVWTWDARPFPEFPARTEVWADGENWRRGHWLTGRVGQSPLADIAADIASRAGLDNLDTSSLRGVLAGFRIDAPSSARAVLERLGAAFGFTLADRADGPAAIPVNGLNTPVLIERDRLVEPADPADRLAFTRAAPEEQIAEARLIFTADDGDYRAGAVSARGLDHVQEGAVEVRLPALADRSLAREWAGGLLARARAEGETALMTLPPSLCALEAGDTVQLDVGPSGRAWRLAALDGLNARPAELTGAPAGPALIAGPEPGAASGPKLPGRPLLRLLDLPPAPGEGAARGGLWAVGWADPWPGALVLFAGASAEVADERARITEPAWCGELTAALAPGAEGRWDRAGAVELRLHDGALSASNLAAVLGGANRLAVETDLGWEVLAFETAVLTGPDTWRLTGLLRGLGGSPSAGAEPGANVVVLDGAGVVLPVTAAEREAPITVIAVPPARTLTDASARQVEAVYAGADLAPLRPVHLRSRWTGDDLALSWIRRSRIDADAWTAGEIPLGEEAERYRVRLYDAADSLVVEREVQIPGWTIPATELANWLPGGLTGAWMRVAQIGAGYGAGAEAIAPLDPVMHG
ncbi:MAG: glycoside hydrolase/phage tail family protein [Alphaproteobacteria bacterium]|nr:glycoside hydrolase/phage tail family protein [Alphaproteobacteria bacterium]